MTSEQLQEAVNKYRSEYEKVQPQQETESRMDRLNKIVKESANESAVPEQTFAEKHPYLNAIGNFASVGVPFLRTETNKELSTGAAKKVINQAVNVGKLGSKALPLPGISQENIKSTFDPIQEKLKPTSTTQKIGGELVTVAELFTPMGKESAVPAVSSFIAKKLPSIAKYAPAISKLLFGTASEATKFGSIEYANTGDKKKAEKAALIGGAIGAASSAIEVALTSKAGEKSISNFSDKLAQNLNRIRKSKQQDFYKQQGENVGEWLNNRGLATGKPEDVVDNIAKHFLQSKENVDSAISMVPGKFKVNQVPEEFTAMVDDAYNFAVKTRNPAAKQLSTLIDKFNTAGIDMSDVNTIKRFFEANNKFTYGKDMTGSGAAELATNIDNAVREWQFSVAEAGGLKNLRQLNKEVQASKTILDSLTAEQAGQLGNNQISLTDWIVAAADWKSLILKKGLTGKSAQSFLIQLLNNAIKRPIKTVTPIIE